MFYVLRKASNGQQGSLYRSGQFFLITSGPGYAVSLATKLFSNF